VVRVSLVVVLPWYVPTPDLKHNILKYRRRCRVHTEGRCVIFSLQKLVDLSNRKLCTFPLSNECDSKKICH